MSQLRPYQHRDIALICYFLDIDRPFLLRHLRSLPRQERRETFYALLLTAVRF